MIGEFIYWLGICCADWKNGVFVSMRVSRDIYVEREEREREREMSNTASTSGVKIPQVLIATTTGRREKQNAQSSSPSISGSAKRVDRSDETSKSNVKQGQTTSSKRPRKYEAKEIVHKTVSLEEQLISILASLSSPDATFEQLT